MGVADFLVGQPAQACANGLVEAVVTQHGLGRGFAVEDRVAGGERRLQVLYGGPRRCMQQWCTGAVANGGHVTAFAALAALAGQDHLRQWQRAGIARAGRRRFAVGRRCGGRCWGSCRQCRIRGRGNGQCAAVAGLRRCSGGRQGSGRIHGRRHRQHQAGQTERRPRGVFGRGGLVLVGSGCSRGHGNGRWRRRFSGYRFGVAAFAWCLATAVCGRRLARRGWRRRGGAAGRGGCRGRAVLQQLAEVLSAFAARGARRTVAGGRRRGRVGTAGEWGGHHERPPCSVPSWSSAWTRRARRAPISSISRWSRRSVTTFSCAR
ncbi:hypothetical protein NIPOLPBK_03888 [Stenotrophomonas maltophilia]|nr:hypothetical protein NIPOLPBK_03888 [Stenotrophomonas maltophilia]